MSAFGNDVKDEVYSAIKELFANGYKISDLLDIVRYAVESKECEEGEWKMTVVELNKELSLLIEQGYGNTRVIANINFKSPWDLKKGEKVGDFYLTHLNDVYYQSGDIELGFSDREDE